MHRKKHKRSPYEDTAEQQQQQHQRLRAPARGSTSDAKRQRIRRRPAPGGHDHAPGAADEDARGPRRLRLSDDTDNGAFTAAAVPEPISVDVLEQKKMLLPYLDKIEYINIQLRQRGLLPPEDDTPGVGPPVALPRAIPGATAATGAPLKAPTEPIVKPPHAVQSLVGASAGKQNQNQEPESPTAPRRASLGSLAAPAPKRPKLSAETLRARYPRLVATVDKHLLARSTPRDRPINWLLRLIEEIYDELTGMFILGRRHEHADSPRPEQALGGAGGDRKRMFETKLVLPFLVRKYLEQTLGLSHLADQDTLDLVFNLECNLERFPQAGLFSLFLRELYDDDTLLFFLLVRHLAQDTLDLQLKAKEKTAHSSIVSTVKKFIPDNLFRLIDHPHIPDGTKLVLVTPAGCEDILGRVLAASIGMQQHLVDARSVSPLTLARYGIQEKMKALRNDLRDEITIEAFLTWAVDFFREIPEDIIAHFKYNDDGESLTSLIRLRETITNDAKIEKWMAAYGDEERRLRNMRIELVRMERGNRDNQFRTQIRLLKNRIALQEQELEHLQRKISTTECMVDGVWNDVVRSPRRGRPLTEKTINGATGAFRDSTKDLHSVMGRFHAYIAKLQRRHDIELRAAAVLAKPWKQQMEELKLRMTIRIQRAYRARRKAREIQQKALEELHEQIRQREAQRHREYMDKKRQDALHDRDVQRHQARISAKKEQEEKLKADQQRKQQELLDKLREEEVRQRDAHQALKRRSRAFFQWKVFCDLRRKQKSANRLFLKFQFMKWRHHYVQYLRVAGAATNIQRTYRRVLERRRVRRIFNMNMKRQRIAQRYLLKVQQRHIQRVFNKWGTYVNDQLRLKASLEAVVHRRVTHWFQRWCRYVIEFKQQRLEAVCLIQRVYRGRLARQVFRIHYKRFNCASTIQRVYRGHRGRCLAAARRRVKAHQDVHAFALLQRIRYRLVHQCMLRLHQFAVRERTIRRLEANRLRRLLQCGLNGFVSYRQHKLEKRAEMLRHRYNSAVVIQRNFRRHRCQALFRSALRLHRAAVVVQRVVRGHLGRQRVRRFRWEIAAARSVQTAWRKRKAKRLAERTRADGILLAAYKGDFTATQRAIEHGFWYVVDGERNGILHMAAAAGHKRIVKLCLRHRMDINATNRHRQTPLHLLLANLPPSTYTDDKRVIEARISLAEYMIDHGAWHEAADEHGLTPLLLVAALGHTEATEMLVERVANLEVRSAMGLNAAQLAVEGNHDQTLAVLLASRGFNYGSNAKDTLQLLHTTAGRGLIDCLRVLVGHLVTFPIGDNQLDTRDDEGYTPLIYAISNNNVDAVQCLLENDANPDEKDFFGRSPLHFGVSVGSHGSPQIVELLTAYDVNVDVKDTDGDSPLHLSCDTDSRLECTSLLLSHGAQISSNALGNHPSHIAGRSGAVETLKLLIDYGADMNIKNYEGKTPLGMARMHNQLAVVEFIMASFAEDAVELAKESPKHHSKTSPLKSGEGQSTVDDGRKDDAMDNIDDPTAMDSDDTYPVMEPNDWARAVQHAYRLGSLAEWTHYIDVATELSFFARDRNVDEESSPLYTWETPVEFDAALADTWEVVRGGGSSVTLRTRVPAVGQDDNAGNAEEDERSRAGGGVYYFYRNKVTGEISQTVPPINVSLLQDVVQQSKRHKQLRQRVRKVSADTSASAMEYMRFFHEFEEESAQVRAEMRAAIKIQRHFRAKRTKKMVHTLLFENKCAVDLQRAFRGRQARALAEKKRHEHASATRIQSQWRGYMTRKLEREVHNASRVKQRQRRLSALRIQCAFRGHIARKLLYRERVVQTQGPRGYFAWEQARRRARVVRTYKVWDELELPLEFPGVFFYCHHVTLSCAWSKPKEWLEWDRQMVEERTQLFRWGYTAAIKASAIQLQRLWRARQARIGFRAIMKAVQLMKTAERDYLEDPTNLVKMGNYVLYLHAIQHDYDRARPLYGRLLRTMAQRGPDVPFILFSYGIYLYVTQEDDVQLVEDMILRAKQKDRQIIKYKTAFLGFFRQSMIQNPLDGESNLNYAACLQWLYEQYDEATKYYLRAIAANPRKKGTIELFQDMLNRKKQVDKKQNPARFQRPTGKIRRTRDEEEELRAQYDAYELFRRWQLRQAEEDDLRRKQAYLEEKETNDRLMAAKKIQARYRRRRAIRKVNRVRLERQMALSIAEIAQQKAAYERVQKAFDQITANGIVSKKTGKFWGAKASTSSKPMSIPVTQLDELFRAMNLSLTEAEIHESTAAYQSEHPNVPNANVMDLTHFAQAHPTIASKLQSKS